MQISSVDLISLSLSTLVLAPMSLSPKWKGFSLKTRLVLTPLLVIGTFILVEVLIGLIIRLILK